MEVEDEGEGSGYLLVFALGAIFIPYDITLFFIKLRI